MIRNSISWLLAVCLLLAAPLSRAEFVQVCSTDPRTMVDRVRDFFRAFQFEWNTRQKKREHLHLPFPTGIDPRPSSGLIVLVHGLSSSPHQWWSYKEHIEQGLPDWTLFAPQVKNGGNCALDDAAKPILEAIQLWSEHNPKRPIILIGASNGGRIAMQVANLMDAEHPTLLVSLAGAIGGSRLLDLGLFFKMAHFFTHASIREELPTNSPRIKRLLADARKRAHLGNIHYVFFGLPAAEEYQFFSALLSFPELHHPKANATRHVLMRRAAHCGIVRSAMPIVMTLVHEWTHHNSINTTELDDFVDVLCHAQS